MAKAGYPYFKKPCFTFGHSKKNAKEPPRLYYGQGGTQAVRRLTQRMTNVILGQLSWLVWKIPSPPPPPTAVRRMNVNIILIGARTSNNESLPGQRAHHCCKWRLPALSSDAYSVPPSGVVVPLAAVCARVVQRKCKQCSCVPSGSKDIILKPTDFSQIHILKIGDLRTCKIPLGSSHRPKSVVFWGHFLRI